MALFKLKWSMMVILLLFLVSFVSAENVVNSEDVVEINLGNYKMPINMKIEENYFLKGDLFEVTRELLFYNLNETEKFNFQETTKLDQKKSYYSYFQYDEKGEIIKRKPYLETEYTKNGTELSVTFPDIDILNKSYYYIMEKYNVKYEHWHEGDFWYPFDEFPFNKTVKNRQITHSYDLKINLPKTYEAYYNDEKFSYAIESYFVDSTSHSLSKGSNINIRVCLPQFRPFISSLKEDSREIKFPSVVMPSIQDDPCKFIGPKIHVFFTIGRSMFLKGVYFFSLTILVLLLLLYFRYPQYFGVILGTSITMYIFQQGIVLFFSQNRPTTLTLWDLNGIIILIIIILKLIPFDRLRREHNPINEYTG